MTIIPNYDPSAMDLETIHIILSYYDQSGMLLRDGKNFPTEKHLYSKVWEIREHPELGAPFIHYALHLDASLKHKKLFSWYEREKKELIKKMGWNTFDYHSKEAQNLVLEFNKHKKTIKLKWANWFKETKMRRGERIGHHSFRSIPLLKGA